MQVPLSDIKKLVFPLHAGDRIFLYGVPGAGKTTFAQELIRAYSQDPDLTIVSPTYTYYQKYGDNIYHFDLYRAETMDDIIRIGADDIFDHPETICIIEWPEIIEKFIRPSKTVFISLAEENRDFDIRDVKE